MFNGQVFRELLKSLLKVMPPHITAYTGMEAFTHNLEGYLAKGYHPLGDAVAGGEVKLLWEYFA